MKDLYYIIGPSGSGKDYTYNLLLKIFRDYHLEDNIVSIIPYTTRPPRKGEINGETYNFIKKEDEESLHILEKRTYNVINSNGEKDTWDYMTCKDNIDFTKNHITIGTPESFKALIKNNIKEHFNLYLINITADGNIRLSRQIAREDNPNEEEIKRRYKADEIDFDPKIIGECTELSDYCYIIDNNTNEQFISDLLALMNDIWFKAGFERAFGDNQAEK